MPGNNGGRRLRSKLESVFALHYPTELVQIPVISDCSTDTADEWPASNRTLSSEL